MTDPTPTVAIQKTPRAPLAFIPANLDEAWRIADMLAKSGILPDALRGKPHDILVTIMTGTEMGLSPMAAIRDIYVVKGKGYVSALLKIAFVKQSPECEYFRCIESTDKKAVFETRRRGEGVTRFEYTIEDAVRADLVGKSKNAQKDNWEKNPRLMCRRRCGSELADEVYPDIVRGLGNRDDVQRDETVAINSAPIAYAPPLPDIEEAQVVLSSKPVTSKQVPDEAEHAPVPPEVAEVSREPGEDDDTPIEPESDLAIYAAVKTICDDPSTTEAQLDAISTKGRTVQGPVRNEIATLIITKRAAMKAAKAAGK